MTATQNPTQKPVLLPNQRLITISSTAHEQPFDLSRDYISLNIYYPITDRGAVRSYGIPNKTCIFVEERLSDKESVRFRSIVFENIYLRVKAPVTGSLQRDIDERGLPLEGGKLREGEEERSAFRLKGRDIKRPKSRKKDGKGGAGQTIDTKPTMQQPKQLTREGIVISLGSDETCKLKMLPGMGRIVKHNREQINKELKFGVREVTDDMWNAAVLETARALPAKPPPRKKAKIEHPVLTPGVKEDDSRSHALLPQTRRGGSMEQG